MSKKVDFIIVGAAKAGTTSLYHFLAQHPEVYMSPIKEPNYFADDIDLTALRPEVQSRMKLLNIPEWLRGDMKNHIHRAFIRDPRQYEALFRFGDAAHVRGEASASYLYSATAAKNIAAYNPSAKIIMVLRNPVERAYSHYLMDQRMAVTDLSFEEALAADAAQRPKSWGSTSLYLELGCYSQQVQRYLESFPKENILILLHEELRNNTADTLRRVFSFLQVDLTAEVATGEAHNTAAVPRNTLVKKLIGVNWFRVTVRRALKRTFLKKFIKHTLFTKAEGETLSPKTAAQLRNYFHDDIAALERLLQTDLSAWQQPR